jgi:hypothetical protein
MFLEDFPEGERDAARFKLRRRHLVKQRLKLVMVQLVDQQHIEHIPVEVLDKLYTGKPPADYNDFLSFWHGRTELYPAAKIAETKNCSTVPPFHHKSKDHFIVRM